MRVGTVILPQDLISQVVSKYFWAAKSHLKMNFIALDTKYQNWHLFWRKIAQAHFSAYFLCKKNKKKKDSHHQMLAEQFCRIHPGTN